MAGYSGTPLHEKLGIKEGMTVGLVGAPHSFLVSLGDLPPGVSVSHEVQPADIFVVFAKRSEELGRGFAAAISQIAADGAIWVAWPKKSSGIDTDLTENVMRDLFLPTGMVDNKVAAIDDTWSGLRFVVRKENRPGWRPTA
jgi:hypothetical protein